ncbi:hypothetical protein EFD55_05495 [Rhizobium pisi]|uniref:Uncharacterized protein n=1 Tax=Rhizobium pisi TaxID=574561 RepID=A0A3R9CBL3_9HYPH|nr:hypothetical protein EFD55_05495 [Rhizobium pisi]TCA57684.1 hypothetical protein E0J16_12720 [Rhizobium pisi]
MCSHLTLTLSPEGRGDVTNIASKICGDDAAYPFSPVGRRWPEGSDEGAYGTSEERISRPTASHSSRSRSAHRAEWSRSTFSRNRR